MKILKTIAITAIATLCMTAFVSSKEQDSITEVERFFEANDVEAFRVNNCELILTINGNDYVFRSENRSQYQVYEINDGQDWADFSRAMANRNGKTMIEVNQGTVIADDGEGRDINNFYVKYDAEKFDKGDRVRSMYIYNPLTNAQDDIVCRYDSLYY